MINCLALAQISNTSLATANFSGLIYIWDLETNIIKNIFSAHFLGILQLQYDSFTNYLISSSYDCKIKIYDCTDFSQIIVLQTHKNPV